MSARAVAAHLIGLGTGLGAIAGAALGGGIGFVAALVVAQLDRRPRHTLSPLTFPVTVLIGAVAGIAVAKRHRLSMLALGIGGAALGGALGSTDALGIAGLASFVGALLGVGAGSLVGFANGVILSCITLLRHYPLRREDRYRVLARRVSVIVGFVLPVPAFGLIMVLEGGSDVHVRSNWGVGVSTVLFSLACAVIGRWASCPLAAWYVGAWAEANNA